MAQTDFSIVIPVYKNEESIPALLDSLEWMSQELSGQLEVVFVVDGSPDRCYELLSQALRSTSFKSKLLLHSRNFGSFAAIRTGLIAATGRYFAILAADLQEPQELPVKMLNALVNEKIDVVIGTRESRNDPWLTRTLSSLYWRLYKKLVLPDIPEGGVDVFGCNENFREKLICLDERHSSLIGLIFWLGFRRKSIAYNRLEREYGKSAWTFSKKLNYFLDSVFAFTDLPIKLLISLGLLGIGVAVLFALLLIGVKIYSEIVVPGYAATITTILFFGGLNTAGLGIIGAYVWRAYGNTQARPHAVVMHEISYPRELQHPETAAAQP